jgi:DNA-binding NarL/FixJ family response regulator
LHVVGGIGDMLSLSMENDIDAILLDFLGRPSNNFSLLENVCEAFSSVPVIACLCNDAECERQRALRTGAQDALTKSEAESHALTQVIRSAILRKKESLWQHDRSLEQALTFLQQNPVSARRVMRCKSFGMKPLSESMPYKFLELTKSYSNVLELATSGRGYKGAQLSCQSVQRKLHFLASDLGSLKAGVDDVFDLHTKALEDKSIEKYTSEEQHRKILLELLSDLVSYYRRDEQHAM